MGPSYNSGILRDGILCVKDANGKWQRLGDMRDYELVLSQPGIKITKVIFSGPATIVFWDDGDKTVVKCMDGDTMNYEMGIAMATLKKIFGASYTEFKKDLKEWSEEGKKEAMTKLEKTIDKLEQIRQELSGE